MLTSWGLDGFGSQFMATVLCQELAANRSVPFVESLKTHMEHRDPDKALLLSILTNVSGPDKMRVRPARYPHCTDCTHSSSVCGFCTSPRVDDYIRRRAALSLCGSVPENRTVRCDTAYDCYHARQVQEWEKPSWLHDRRPNMSAVPVGNRTAVIARGNRVKGVFNAEFSILSTVSFVRSCCASFTPLGRSSFANTLSLVHEYC